MPKAFRQLKKITDKKSKNAVLDTVDTLEKWPDFHNIKALKGRVGYRKRAGNWRIIFDVTNQLKIIEIQEVKKRDKNTY